MFFVFCLKKLVKNSSVDFDFCSSTKLCRQESTLLAVCWMCVCARAIAFVPSLRTFSVFDFIVDNCCAGICGMFPTIHSERLGCDRNTIMFSSGVVIVPNSSGHIRLHRFTLYFLPFLLREFVRYCLPVAFGISYFQVQK